MLVNHSTGRQRCIHSDFTHTYTHTLIVCVHTRTTNNVGPLHGSVESITQQSCSNSQLVYKREGHVEMGASITAHRAFQAECDRASSACSWGVGMCRPLERGRGKHDIACKYLILFHLTKCTYHIPSTFVPYKNMYPFFNTSGAQVSKSA